MDEHVEKPLLMADEEVEVAAEDIFSSLHFE